MIWYFTGKILMDHISGAISNWFNQIVSKDSVKQKASHTQKELNEQRDLHTQKELDKQREFDVLFEQYKILNRELFDLRQRVIYERNMRDEGGKLKRKYKGRAILYDKEKGVISKFAFLQGLNETLKAVKKLKIDLNNKRHVLMEISAILRYIYDKKYDENWQQKEWHHEFIRVLGIDKLIELKHKYFTLNQKIHQVSKRLTYELFHRDALGNVTENSRYERRDGVMVFSKDKNGKHIDVNDFGFMLDFIIYFLGKMMDTQFSADDLDYFKQHDIMPIP